MSKGPVSLVCHNCGKENPPKAYCCLSCFKVLRPKEDIPWWRTYIRLSTPTMIGIFIVALGGIWFFKQWIEGIEAQVSMNVKTEEYNVSVTADKRKRQAGIDVESSAESTT